LISTVAHKLKTRMFIGMAGFLLSVARHTYRLAHLSVRSIPHHFIHGPGHLQLFLTFDITRSIHEEYAS
jgi:hypothetical protein